MQATKAGNWPVNGPFFIEDIFSTWLYTGNSSTQTINNGIDLAGKGGLVWTKTRSNTYANGLYDTARGAGVMLRSDSTSANNTTGELSAFGATGFSVSYNSLYAQTNANGATYASWTFRKQPKFFDVVTWTGDGAARTIAHNLGSKPGCIIVKCTSSSTVNGSSADWFVWHKGVYDTYGIGGLKLNTTGNYLSVNASFLFGSNDPATSTGFGLSGENLNWAGETYVAYLFAHNAGGFGLTGTDNVISCGSFTTNGSGVAEVNLGYEPQWVLIKQTNAGSNWMIHDSMRGMSLTTYAELRPNTSDAENAGVSEYVVPQATGFKAIISQNNPFIYIAIRRGPMKVPTTGTSVFAPVVYTGSGGGQVLNTSFPSDTVMHKSRTSADTYHGDIFVHDRLRGVKVSTQIIRTSKTVAENGNTSYWIHEMNNNNLKWASLSDEATGNLSPKSYVLWNFRRAPGFFDEVCYTGTGSATTQTHNLGVVPELMIVKNRTTAGTAWTCYASTLGASGYIDLNSNNASSSSANIWNSTLPTASVFSVGIAGRTNESAANLVAYLFASCPGVSKVGSYTGTGTTQVINCGFTAGSRFVLIKRTDSTGDWYVWDSARGIVAGNDPYLLLNSTAAEVTNTDYVDTAATGFEISSTAPAAINASGGTFIFLAIA
jgi:hypothetical protein